MRSHPVIAVDGTAASGKGTLARLLSETYNGAWLDTGLLYRWVGLRAEYPEHAIGLARELAHEFSLVMLEDPDLRGEAASVGSSVYSAIPEVRAALMDIQKNFADTLPEGRSCVVMDGRDIGTIIAPDAEAKFFVDADTEIRAHRRTKELHLGGRSDSYEAVLEAMRQRDARDTTRDVAPTIAAEDAYLIDTTHLDVAGMLEKARIHVETVTGLRAVR